MAKYNLLKYELFYRKALTRMVNNRLIYKNVPDTIDINFLHYMRNIKGYYTLLKADDSTLRGLDGAIYGIGVYNQATDFTSVNPVSKYSGMHRVIGEDCVTIYSTLNKREPLPIAIIINKFARQLANIDISIDCAIYNSRLSLRFNANNDVEKKNLELAYSKFMDGMPFITLNSKALSALQNQPLTEFFPVKNSYLVDELLRDKRSIYCDFLSFIGINNTPFEKSERLVSGEASSNNTELYLSIWDILESEQRGWEEFNKMFGQNVTVELNQEPIDFIREEVDKGYPEKEEVGEDNG